MVRDSIRAPFALMESKDQESKELKFENTID